MRTIVNLALLAAVLFGCRGEEPPAKVAAPTGTKLNIVGSSTMAPLVSELARTFVAKHPGVQIDVSSGGSGRGISEARAGSADIGMASRALTESERDLTAFSIARDGICLIVHKDNPVQALTSKQVLDIFTGRVSSWKALGGGDAPIVVVTRAEGRSALEVFTQHFKLKAADIKAASAKGENAEAFKAISSDSKAITFVSLGEAERQAQAGVPIKLLPIDGIAATSDSLRAGKYPVSRSLTLVTRSLPSGTSKAFIDFALSPDAAPVIKRYDFVPFVD